MATLSEVFSNIANAIRIKTGKTATMTPAEMATEIGTLSDTSADTVTAATMLSGTTAHDKSGEKVTGTIATKTASNMTTSGATVTVPAGYYATQATKSVATAAQATPSVSIDSNGKITATATQTTGYVDGGTKFATKQLTTQAAKTITPSTSSQTAVASGVYTTGAVTVSAVPTQTKSATPTTYAQSVTPDIGKFLSQVTINSIPSTYVKPTATKAATTYTPTTSNQTIAAGTYCSGVQTIKGDANLVAENIKSGVSIFGVNGSLEADDGIPTYTIANATGYQVLVAGTILNDGTTTQAPYYFVELMSLPSIVLPVLFVDVPDDFAGKSFYYSVGSYTSARVAISEISLNAVDSLGGVGNDEPFFGVYILEGNLPEFNAPSNITEGSTLTLYIE